MKFLRFMHLFILGIILLPIIIIISIGYLFFCIYANYLLKYKYDENIKENFIIAGIKTWYKLIYNGLKMNKEFILYGI